MSDSDIQRLKHRLIDSRDNNLKTIAASQLAAFGAKAIPALRDILELRSDCLDLDARCIAVKTLGRLGAEASVVAPILVECLGALEWEVRSASVRTLMEVAGGMEQMVPHFIAMLKDPEWIVRLNAMEACEGIPIDEAVSALVPMLRDEREEVRGKAAKFIARQKEMGLKAVLTALSAGEITRAQAQPAIKRIREKMLEQETDKGVRRLDKQKQVRALTTRAAA